MPSDGTKFRYKSLMDFAWRFYAHKIDAPRKAEELMRLSIAYTRYLYQEERNGFAGFTTGTPWFYVNQNYKQINVAAFKDQSLEMAYKPMTNKDRYKDYYPIVWLGENDYFYLTRLSRDLHRVDVCKVTLGDDTARVVIEERLNTYIETRSLREVKNNG